MSDESKPLSRKHKAFADHYLQCFNGTEAYLRVYPKATYESAKAAAALLLTNINIKSYLDDRLNALQMTADEALKLQSDIARGDITQFFTPIGNLDFDKLMKSGNGRLVKRIKQKTITKIGKTETDEDTEILETELELYPADAAQERILKLHGKFTEKLDLSNSDGSLKPKEDDEQRFNRAISTLADTLREVVSGTSTGADSKMDTDK